MAYEYASQAQMHSKHPAPGKMIDIGSHKMHIQCYGEGSPTVVFESAMDNYGSMAWVRLLHKVSDYTRACAYDRSGVMWSERRSSNGEFYQEVVKELYLLLENSEQSAPYLLVGHSLGGAYATIFAHKYPDLVSGVILLDSSHPGLVNDLGLTTDEWIENLEDDLLIWSEPFLRNTGILRLASMYSRHHEVEVDWSKAELEIVEGYQSHSFLALQSEVRWLNETLKQLDVHKDLGDIPLKVVDAQLDVTAISDSELKMIGLSRERLKSLFEAQALMHQDKVNWSINAELLTLYNTRHYVQFQVPERVDDIIKSMVLDYRSGIKN